MMRHYPHLGSASDWSCRQHGISALVSQTSFRGESSDGIRKCCLFSQAVCDKRAINFVLKKLPQHELPLHRSFGKRPTNFDI